MPKMYGVLITGCDVCGIDPVMLPYYGDRRGADTVVEAWIKGNKGDYCPRLKPTMMRIKFPDPNKQLMKQLEEEERAFRRG